MSACEPGAQRGQNRVLGPLEFGLQTIASHRGHAGNSARAASAPKCQSVCPAHFRNHFLRLAYLYLCVHSCPAVQKKALPPWKLEVQVAVGCLCGCWEPKARSRQEQQVLTQRAISSPLSNHTPCKIEIEINCRFLGFSTS